MFDIKFEGKDNKMNYAWQTSWGFTTRSIGIAIMTHSDNKGLVFPHTVSQYQIVLIPIIMKNKEKLVFDYTIEVYKTLGKLGFRVMLDDRDNYNPGWKYN